MRKTIFIASILLTAVAGSAYAVDGYKDFKFGSTIEEVKLKNVCHLMPKQDENTENLQYFFCLDLPFGDSLAGTKARFIFFRGKLVTISVLAGDGIEKLDALDLALSKKYGQAKHLPNSMRDRQLFRDGLSDFYGSSVFDDETILTLIKRSEKYEIVYVIYNQKGFNEGEERKKEAAGSMEKDL